MHDGLYMSTDFGVDSSNRLPFTVQTDRQTDRQEKFTFRTDHPTHASATAGVSINNDLAIWLANGSH